MELHCARMTTVKEAVKESLVGTTQEPQLSQQVRTNFMRYAEADQETGELFMTEDDFVDAIAPKNEDYVSRRQPIPFAIIQGKILMPMRLLTVDSS